MFFVKEIKKIKKSASYQPDQAAHQVGRERLQAYLSLRPFALPNSSLTKISALSTKSIFKLSPAIAVGLLSVMVILGGAGWASANSLPSSPLYPIKLVIEKARLAATSTPQAKIELRLAFAAKRLQEAVKLAQIEPNNITDINKTLDNYDFEIAQVSSAVVQVNNNTKTELVAKVVQKIQDQQDVLRQVAISLPVSEPGSIIKLPPSAIATQIPDRALASLNTSAVTEEDIFRQVGVSTKVWPQIQLDKFKAKTFPIDSATASSGLAEVGGTNTDLNKQSDKINFSPTSEPEVALPKPQLPVPIPFINKPPTATSSTETATPSPTLDATNPESAKVEVIFTRELAERKLGQVKSELALVEARVKNLASEAQPILDQINKLKSLVTEAEKFFNQIKPDYQQAYVIALSAWQQMLSIKLPN